MHEAMNTRKTSSGIVFSVCADKESNTSAALRLGIRTSLMRVGLLKNSQSASDRKPQFIKVIKDNRRISPANG